MRKIFLTTILSLAFVLSVFSSPLTVFAWSWGFGGDPGAAPSDPSTDFGSSPQVGCKVDPTTKQETCTLPNPLQGEKTEASQIISTAIKAALGIVGALTLLMLVWGGFEWLTSAGSPEKVKSGTQTMVWAVIGVVLVFASYILLSTFTSYLVPSSVTNNFGHCSDVSGTCKSTCASTESVWPTSYECSPKSCCVPD